MVSGRVAIQEVTTGRHPNSEGCMYTCEGGKSQGVIALKESKIPIDERMRVHGLSWEVRTHGSWVELSRPP